MTHQRSDNVLIERTDGIVTVTINRPEKKNAITVPMFAELTSVFNQIAHSSTDRVVILTGAGGNFCSGADLWAEKTERLHILARMRQLGEAAIALQRMPQPVIAKINGVCVGAGMSLALGCDLMLAAQSSRFSMIFAKRALSLDMGASWLLPRQIGMHRAKELALFGDIISATDAHEMGLLNRVVADDRLDSTVDEWARRLLSGPPVAMAQSKFLLNDSLTMSLTQAIDNEGAAQSVNSSTADSAEALAAFTERRSASYHGF
ncbi:MAG TPA: enoyl-CoA hydratase-related protein [Ilumatobacteraceae bacterium]|nr:enoyl-CoA hydratase-related protein [Ilumatobacteraceae bacterium]